jgi:hypothetical protein
MPVGQRPADQPARNATDRSPEWIGRGCRVRVLVLVLVLDIIADLLKKVQVGGGKEAEAHHEHRQASPDKPSRFSPSGGYLAEEVLALLVDVVPAENPIRPGGS